MASLNDLQYASFGTSTSGTAQNIMGLYDCYHGTIACTTGDSVVPGTVDATFGGVTRGITMAQGTMTGTGTVVLTLTDALGGTMFIGTQVESGTTYFGTVVPIDTSMHWVSTPSGTQNAANALKFDVHYQR